MQQILWILSAVLLFPDTALIPVILQVAGGLATNLHLDVYWV